MEQRIGSFSYFNYSFHFILAGTGVWLDCLYEFMPNRRGGLNLIFNGYLYTVERKYNSTINWVCNKNSNSSLRCPARCVTAGDNAIKLSQKLHNHEPVVDQDRKAYSGQQMYG
ncbi:uncharacterized protein LOC129614473 [Condylostylus longicornis]|uniref:uncharacterized protein LOC129614473 n=1 Tax=Condylostylus longicornis TaxID=2530218 RepID=UPI00244E5000|nr:uncharacterized protein LOC129614473 [Condylostylus longicornis]